MSDLHLVDGFFATPQRFLWHPATGTAILSDVHLGIEGSLARAGIALPAVHLPALRVAWRAVCERLLTFGGKGRVVIAGDLFDDAAPGTGAIQVARELVGALPSETVVSLVMGNHDPAVGVLRDIFADLSVAIADAATVADYSVVHGHIAQGYSVAKGVIVGHQHPAVVLSNRVEAAKMICYAVCRSGDKEREIPVIVLPAFSRVPLGLNLMTEGHWILDLPRPEEKDIRIAGIVEKGAEGRVLDFGTLADLRFGGHCLTG